MYKYVALLRGINVGGNNKVSMQKLKEMFVTFGFSDVITYINSGNVIFRCDKKISSIVNIDIEKAIYETFGFPVKIVVRDLANIQKLVSTIPNDYENNVVMKTDILFLYDTVDDETSIQSINTATNIDTLIYVPGAIIWHILRANYAKSGMNDLVKNPLYKKVTVRNVNTVRKILEIMTTE